MSRFFVAAGDVGEKNIVIHSKEDIKHIIKVLRLSVGDKIDISDSTEWEYEVEIAAIDEEQIETRILDKQRFAREPNIKISLFQGIPKQSKMETIVQKCVEMGVYSITPIFTDRTVVADKGNFHKKRDRWQKVSAEAVKQCRRGIIPQVCKEMNFMDMTGALDDFDLVLFPYENEEERTIKDCLRNLQDQPKTVAIIIGPEGGFSDKEADQLKNMGADCVTLGKTVLRTETAGVVALAMAVYELVL